MAADTPSVTPASGSCLGGAFGTDFVFGAYAPTTTHFKVSAIDMGRCSVVRTSDHAALNVGVIVPFTTVPAISVGGTGFGFHGLTNFTLRNYTSLAGANESPALVVPVDVLYAPPSFSATVGTQTTQQLDALPGDTVLGGPVFSPPADSADPSDLLRFSFNAAEVAITLKADDFAVVNDGDIVSIAQYEISTLGFDIKMLGGFGSHATIMLRACKTVTPATTGLGEPALIIIRNISPPSGASNARRRKTRRRRLFVG